MFRKFIAIAGAVALVLGAAACSGSGSGSPSDDPAAAAQVADAVIIDVRTPAEYAEGHLDGAILLDLNGGQFAQELPNLAPQASYLVYCRSGNRSGQAAAMMEDAGFDSVSDLGSLQQAAEATGVEIVTGP